MTIEIVESKQNHLTVYLVRRAIEVKDDRRFDKEVYYNEQND